MRNRCRHCKSKNVVKYGIRYTKKKGKVQRYRCNDCNKRFTPNKGFLYTTHTKKMITLALDLYFKGLSLRKISDHFKQFYNTKVSHVTVYFWIRKYSQMISNFVDTLPIQPTRIWNADETVLFFRKHPHWMWSVIDKDSRFLIAEHLTRFRSVLDTDNVFLRSRKLVKEDPKVVVTDKFTGYKKMIEQNFPNAEHKSFAGIRGRVHNNMIERFNGNVKERYKVMRGFHSLESARIILDGWRAYYNFIRPHMGINGNTPSKAVGIGLDLKNNRWLSLIEKSVK